MQTPDSKLEAYRKYTRERTQAELEAGRRKVLENEIRATHPRIAAHFSNANEYEFVSNLCDKLPKIQWAAHWILRSDSKRVYIDCYTPNGKIQLMETIKEFPSETLVAQMLLLYG